MKCILLLALFAITTDGQVANLEAFSWSAECGQGDPITVLNLTVTPDPIRLPGIVTINADIVSIEDIVDAPGTIVDIVVEREINGSYVEQPCLDFFDVGSCTFDLCPTLDERHPDNCTQQQIDAGVPCHCKDMVAGEYNIEDYVVVYRKQPPAVLVNGDYHAQVTLTSDHQLTCLDIYFTLLVDLHDHH